MTEQEKQAWREIPKVDCPRAFLLAVMNNPGIAMEDRIEAAGNLMTDNTTRALGHADEATESTNEPSPQGATYGSPELFGALLDENVATVPGATGGVRTLYRHSHRLDHVCGF